MMLPLPTTLVDLNAVVLPAALALLPSRMDTPQARVMLLASAGQESELSTRRQYGNGPARGLWQFERGTRASRGGVWGVYLHDASRDWLRQVCAAREVQFDPLSIWEALERDDVLAAAVARLLLWTDAKPLPATNDTAAAWDLYAKRTWRPGKPHPDKWPRWHRHARAVLGLP